MRNAVAQSARKSIRGIADQEGASNAGEKRAKRLDAACLGHASGDPIDRVVADERPRRCVSVRRLAVVDVSDAVYGCDQLLPVREAGKALDPRCHAIASDPAAAT